jgi:predicted transcriptional regulator
VYSLQEIKDTLEKDGRGIKIIDSTFINTTSNATFIHPIYGEWEATPKRVVFRKTTHPIEANARRSASNKEAREKDPTIQEKTQKTCLERYGTKSAAQSELVKNKARSTNLKKYGKTSPLASEQIRKRTLKTKQEKYGDVNYNNRDKAKLTTLERYGVQNPNQSPNIIAKTLKTKESKGLITRPRGVSWSKLAEELGIPRTSIQAFCRKYGNTEEVINQFVQQYGKNYSDIEMEVAKNLNLSHFNGPISTETPCRPDFKINDTTYLNADGLYWHSQKVDRDPRYHFKLRESFEKAGLRLFQFRSDEIKNKMDILRSIVNNHLGKTVNKVFARKCVVNAVPAKVAAQFLATNHMMGRSNSKFIGLYYEGKLVSVIGYKTKNGVLDIDRFANLINHSVVGSLSRLLKRAVDLEKPSKVHYWVDLRYGTGDSLELLGFNKQRDVQSWQWTDFKNVFNRLKCRANMDERKLSQHEYAKEMGLYQIYDAGQRLFVKNYRT